MKVQWQVIRKSEELALVESILAWEQKADEKFDLPTLGNIGGLIAVGHEDLEDVVGLYLQVEKGWLIIPSTAKKSSPLTEFILRKPEGTRAYVQVKSGLAKIDFSQVEIPAAVDEFFAFYPTYQATDRPLNLEPKITCIEPETLLDFAKKRLALMPRVLRMTL